MKMDLGISDPNRQAISDGLMVCLSNTYAIYLKTQNYHWNVTGSDFFSLHILFEKQYEELAEAVDEIAERIRALGYYVDATFGSFKAHTDVKEGDKVLNEKEMIAALVDAHGVFIRHARKVAEVADQDGDFATVDMLGRRLGAHEKMAWFLRAHL